MSILALAAMDKLFRKNGAKRVSKDAKEALREAMREYGNKICSKSIKLAKHGKRSTVKKEDVKLALDNIGSE